MVINRKQLQQLYLAYFGRPADPCGINYWLSKSSENNALINIASSLSCQDEYKKSIIYNESIDLQINQFYLNLFGRKADFDGLKYWLSMIDQGTHDINLIPLDLLWSSLYNDSNMSKQSKIDLQTLENKINSAELFTEIISSSVNWSNWYQPDSLDPWVTGKALNFGVSFLSRVNYSENPNKEYIIDILESITIESTKISNESIISLDNVSLKIPINSSENRKITKIFADKMLKTVIGGGLTYQNQETNVEALKGLTLTIMDGERVGLIGHNGSGKSSFLRLISGIYMPTSGRITIEKDVYPMLQKTFLTSMELSGLDAIKAYYLMINNDLIGFDRFVDDIISFSGLGSFINLPVKTYSEGMSARLIFSMLTSSPHECLAIDEGFGTGDADFFDKAQKRLQSFMDSAATLILASHSELLLKQFCTRGLVFNQGSIVFDGPLDAALNYYHTDDYYN